MQFLSPIQLVFCLILFFLPWIEVQCVPSPAALGPAPGMKADPNMNMKLDMPPMGPQSLLTQSGLQIATGGYSISNPLLEGEMKGKPKAGGKDDDGPPAAPLLFLFPLAALAGVVVGFLPLGGPVRAVVIVLCCLVAGGTIGAQAAIGFPVKQSFEEDKAKAKRGGGGEMRLEEGMDIKVVWKVPLYLTFVLLIGAAGTAFLGGGKPAEKSRRRSDDRYDDDRDDRDDDRPRRRDDRDRDDDEDDGPPRRRARRDD